MFDTASPSSGEAGPPQREDGARAMPAFVRDASELRASFVAAAPGARLDTHYGHGSLRLRMLRARATCEAVLINTGGGIAGGDRLTLDFDVGAQAGVVITTQAAEKIYRAEHEPSAISTRITVAAGGRIDWLPQETILFDRARLVRRLDVDLAPDATLTALECVVLGRSAAGETVESGGLRDRWRIRRDGRLVLAEDVRLEGRIADQMRRAAIGNGARAMATLVYVGPDAESRLVEVRAAASTRAAGSVSDANTSASNASASNASAWNASAWNGCLVARFVAHDAAALRSDTVAVVTALLGGPMPRSWAC